VLVYELHWAMLSGTRIAENAAHPGAAGSTNTVGLALLAMLRCRAVFQIAFSSHTPRPIRRRFPCAKVPQFRAIAPCRVSAVENNDSYCMRRLEQSTLLELWRPWK